MDMEAVRWGLRLALMGLVVKTVVYGATDVGTVFMIAIMAALIFWPEKKGN